MIDFQEIQKYLDDVMVTDINYNGRKLWIDHLKKGRFCDESFRNHNLIEKICYQIANETNQNFNISSPLLECDIDCLRISIFHPSICASGISLSIRKTLKTLRYDKYLLLRQQFISEVALNMLKRCIECGCNLLISGLPGSGKTEFMKFLSQYIPPQQRVITMEDSLEMHYDTLYPQKDSVALRISSQFTYSQAIKASLRQRPDWLIVSEIRGEEVLALLQSVSTGAKLMSTVHADSASQIPKRLLHMFEKMELTNEGLLQIIYEMFDIGIHLVSKMTPQGIVRYVEEIVYYEVDSQYQCKHSIIYQRNKTNIKIPKGLKNHWERMMVK